MSLKHLARLASPDFGLRDLDGVDQPDLTWAAAAVMEVVHDGTLASHSVRTRRVQSADSAETHYDSGGLLSVLDRLLSYLNKTSR